jgi:hypothetical protein
MAENNPLDDPELRHLESRLKAVVPAPASRQRDRLLYACGQAAGRAQMGRRVQAAIAVAALCLCVSAGLGFALLERGGSQSVVRELRPNPAFSGQPGTSTANRPLAEPLEPVNGQGPRLTAATSFQQFLALNQLPSANLPGSGGADVPPRRILSAADPFLPDDP